MCTEQTRFRYELSICQYIGRTRFNCVDIVVISTKAMRSEDNVKYPCIENWSYLGLKHHSADTRYCMGECVIFIFVILYILKAMINDCRVQKSQWFYHAVRSFFIFSTLLCGFSLCLKTWKMNYSNKYSLILWTIK